MKRDAIGLDIGGANIKAATSAGEALSRRFELWKHPERLSDALAEVSKQLGPGDRIAVTMTGELCDCFHTKREGVRHILASIAKVFPEERVRVWSTTRRFVSIEQATANPMAVAAANWHAQGWYVASLLVPEPNQAAILVDCGSTTTDIIPMYRRMCLALGKTDPDRMKTKELLYTGARRTPLCALFSTKVAAEFFATVHDAYLLLKLSAEDPDDLETADGKPATSEFAHARMARMLGGDSEITSKTETLELARNAFTCQRSMIFDSMGVIASRLPAPTSRVFLSGSGEFLARAAAEQFAADDRQSCNPPTIVSLSELWGTNRSSAACAYSLAMLAEEMPW